MSNNKLNNKILTINEITKQAQNNTTIWIRVGWYDRTQKFHGLGSWHKVDDVEEKREWVFNQNKIYPDTHYWLEYTDDQDPESTTVGKNIELLEMIKCTNADNISEFILLN